MEFARDPAKNEKTRRARGFCFDYGVRRFAGPTVDAIDQIDGRDHVLSYTDRPRRPMDHQCVEGEWEGPQAMAKSGMTLAEIMAGKPNVDLAKIDATTEEDTGRQMREEGYDRNATVRDEDMISPAIIRKRLGMSQRRSADAIHVRVVTL